MRLGWVALATAVLSLGTVSCGASEDELVGVCAEVFEIPERDCRTIIASAPDDCADFRGYWMATAVAYSFGEFGLQEGIRHVRSMLC